MYFMLSLVQSLVTLHLAAAVQLCSSQCWCVLVTARRAGGGLDPAGVFEGDFGMRWRKKWVTLLGHLPGLSHQPLSRLLFRKRVYSPHTSLCSVCCLAHGWSVRTKHYTVYMMMMMYIFSPRLLFLSLYSSCSHSLYLPRFSFLSAIFCWSICSPFSLLPPSFALFPLFFLFTLISLPFPSPLSFSFSPPSSPPPSVWCVPRRRSWPRPCRRTWRWRRPSKEPSRQRTGRYRSSPPPLPESPVQPSPAQPRTPPCSMAKQERTERQRSRDRVQTMKSTPQSHRYDFFFLKQMQEVIDQIEWSYISLYIHRK